jgi:hypothetical protein
LWPQAAVEAAIGRVVGVPHHTGARVDLTVVGVVEDVRPHPGEAASPELYVPISSEVLHRSEPWLSAVVRFAPGQWPPLSQVDAGLDRRLGPSATTMTRLSDSLDTYVQQPRFQALLFGVLALIAVGLAAVGLYAVASYDARQRRFEMGVRVALGATADQVRRAVLGVALQPVLVGTVIGLLGAWWGGRLLQAFVFELDARDPWTLAGVALVMVLTAVLAAWIPAARAARADSGAVLRA